MSTIKCKKKVAILLPTYNGETYLAKHLESLLNQTFQDICVFIHDDGSTDRTVQIVDEYRKKYKDKIKIIDGESTGGARNNFFYLLKTVEADYIMFSDQDDIWLPNKVELTLNEMLKIENKDYDIPVLIHTDLRFVDADLHVIAESYFAYKHKNENNISLKQLLLKNVFVGCTMMLNRNLRDEALIYSDINNIYMHDWWIGLLASIKGKIGFINTQTILYRQHNGNAEGNRYNKTFFFRIKRWLNIKNAIVLHEEYLMRKKLFCKELAMHVNKDYEYYDLIYGLGTIDRMNKIQRIKFYKQYDLLEEHKSKLWQFIWI